MKKLWILTLSFLFLAGCSTMGIHEVKTYQNAKIAQPMTLPKNLRGKQHYPIPSLSKNAPKTSRDLTIPPNMQTKKMIAKNKTEKTTAKKTTVSRIVNPIEKVMSAID